MQLMVLGMHRSGTSMVARLLNLMGAYFGAEGISIGANQENVKGFWERSDVVALHESVLHSMHSRWDRVADFHAEQAPGAANFAASARSILRDLDSHRPWLIKDPRLCLMLPLWRPVLQSPVCILVHRAPYQVAQSLHTRNGFPIAVGIALWEYYTLAALRDSTGWPRLLIRHRDIMADPVGAAAQLLAGLQGLGVSGLSMPAEKAIREYVDAELFRERGTAERLREFANRPVCELDAALDDGALLNGASAPPLSEGSREILRWHQDATNRIEGLQFETADQARELQRKTDRIETLNRSLSRLSGIESELQRKAERIDELNGLVSEIADANEGLKRDRYEARDRLRHATWLLASLEDRLAPLSRLHSWKLSGLLAYLEGRLRRIPVGRQLRTEIAALLADSREMRSRLPPASGESESGGTGGSVP